TAAIERTAAADATGFSLNRYDSWNEHKWSGPKTARKRNWRKLHAVVGCRTNIFVSAAVTEKNVADITMLPSIVSDHPRFFDFQDFVADKAYSSREVLKFLGSLGLDPYIPFQRRVTGNAKGSLMWKYMYEFFHDNQQAYLEHYHQRSNVETCFHM